MHANRIKILFEEFSYLVMEDCSYPSVQYSDVIWASWCLKSPAACIIVIIYWSFYQGKLQVIPLTKGQ